MPGGKTTLGLIAACAGLSACAAVTPEERAARVSLYCAPIEIALATPLADLRTAAETGDGQMQFALAIALDNGLGVRPDTAEAALWRARAVAQRGVRTTSVYAPGYKHHPGSVIPISTPLYDVSFEQQIAVDRCIAALKLRSGDAPDLKREPALCGGPDAFLRLRDAWRKASVSFLPPSSK